MIEASSVTAAERVIDLREITPRLRHALVLQLFAHLDEAGSLQLVVDHDPRPLGQQLEAANGARCRWIYLEQGPDVWRVRLRIDSRVPRPCSSRSCGAGRR